MAVILCVDVGPAVAAILETYLRDLKHEPVHAQSVDAAILAIQDRPFDLAILDTAAAERNGFPFLEHLREHDIAVPTIVMADFTSVDRAIEALGRGAADYLTKPLRAESVRLAVTTALEIDRLRKENREVLRDIASRRDPGAAAAPPEAPGDGHDPSSPSLDGDVLNLRELETIAIRRALMKTGGHRIKAAELLGINERTLRNKLKLDELKDSVPPRPSNGAPRR
ncbi:MAG TPA: response regulator [Candidatus Eisenbacteria bacterium]|nr:response regulator [Candidatus Eisenbacteria bacterium]